MCDKSDFKDLLSRMEARECDLKTCKCVQEITYEIFKNLVIELDGEGLTDNSFSVKFNGERFGIRITKES
jgi:hypothetical protein